MKRLTKVLALLLTLTMVAAACGSDDDGGGDAAPATTAAPAATAAPVADDPIEFDYGVDEDTIRVGAIADLSGIFSGLVTQIVDAQTVYWDMVNANGGIGGKQVELVVLDNGYDVPPMPPLAFTMSQ